MNNDLILSNKIKPMYNLPSLADLIHGHMPMPLEAFYLGEAMDELPVLLNIGSYDAGRPILFVGGEGSGKTKFAMTMFEASMHIAPKFQNVHVITSNRDEWSLYEQYVNRKGSNRMLYSMHETGADNLVLTLASYAHAYKKPNDVNVLVIDDFDMFMNVATFDTVQNLKWLLIHGSQRNVFVIGTSRRYNDLFPAFLWGNGVVDEDFKRFKEIYSHTVKDIDYVIGKYLTTVGLDEFVYYDGRDNMPFGIGHLHFMLHHG